MVAVIMFNLEKMSIMKKYILSLVLTVVIAGSSLFAQTDQFPDYSTQNYGVSLNLNRDSINFFADDPQHRICDSVLYYSVTGMAPTAGNHWITTTGGTQTASTVNTPTALLCRMLHAYASGSTSSVSALYRSQDIQSINSIL